MIARRLSRSSRPDDDGRKPIDGTRFVLGQAFALCLMSVMRFAVTWNTSDDDEQNARVLADLMVDAVSVAFITTGYLLFNPVFMNRRGRAFSVLLVVLSSLVAARAPLTVAFEPCDLVSLLLRQVFITILLVLLAGAGLMLVDLGVRARLQEQAELVARSNAAEALERITRRELEVRAEVAQRLHGSLQQSVILVERRVRDVQRDLGLSDATAVHAREELAIVLQELLVLRERDVRAASESLRPTAIELGAPQAIRLLLSRLPSSISFEVSIDERFERLERLDNPRLEISLRVLIVEIVQEALSNALKHGRADHVELEIGFEEGPVLCVVFRDDGVGPQDARQPLRGLRRLRERVVGYSGELDLQLSGRGATLRVRIPMSDYAALLVLDPV